VAAREVNAVSAREGLVDWTDAISATAS
jgi:hypothetical protein